MSRLRTALRHAFAIEAPGPHEPTPDQAPVVDRLCRALARRRLTVPGLVALEMSRPLGYLASQAMHALSPIVWSLARRESHEEYRRLTEFLEHRGAFEYLSRRIEHFESESARPPAGDAAQADTAPEPDA